MKDSNGTTLTRRHVLGAVAAATATLTASRAFATPALLRGEGDIRMISMQNPRTGDSINSVYWVDGHYIDEVMADISFLMRDWRTDQIMPIAPGLLDIMSATHRLLETREPFTLYSGYRSPQTNRALRQNSRGVARKSYHTKGMAADLHLETRSVRQIARAGMRLASGGVGRYSRSDFVHLDSGPHRDWGR